MFRKSTGAHNLQVLDILSKHEQNWNVLAESGERQDPLSKNEMRYFCCFCFALLSVWFGLGFFNTVQKHASKPHRSFIRASLAGNLLMWELGFTTQCFSTTDSAQALRRKGGDPVGFAQRRKRGAGENNPKCRMQSPVKDFTRVFPVLEENDVRIQSPHKHTLAGAQRILTHCYIQEIHAHSPAKHTRARTHKYFAGARGFCLSLTDTFSQVGQESANPGPVTPRRFPGHASYVTTEQIREHRQTCQHLSLLAGFHLHGNKHGR